MCVIPRVNNRLLLFTSMLFEAVSLNSASLAIHTIVIYNFIYALVARKFTHAHLLTALMAPDF